MPCLGTRGQISEVLRREGELILEWEIPRFPDLECGDVDWYESPAFPFAGARWHLGVYPDRGGWMNLNLHRDASGPSSVTANASARVKGSGERREMQWKFVKGGGCWLGAPCRTGELAERGRLPGGTLTLTCHMRAPRTDSSLSSGDSSLADLPEGLGLETFLWHVYKKRKFFDVHFELRTGKGTVVLTGHRLILALWSPKFADMFYGKEKRNNLERVPLEDVDPEVFESMLGFMYGCDPPFDSIKKATELLKLATEFEVQSLVELCRSHLSGVYVDVTNVFEVLERADFTGDRGQVEKCLEIVQRKTRNILTLYSFSDFTPAMVHTVLDCPRLTIKSEYELFNWLFAWAKIRYKECSEYGSMREVLREFLPKLDFLDLTNSEFASILSQYEGVFDDKEALSIFMNIGVRGSKELPDWCSPRRENRIYLE